MITEVTGFVVKETSYAENSKIINVLTKEKGLIGIMCKGAKSLKSKNRTSTELLSYGVFSLYYKENKLSTLINVDIINPLFNIKSSLDKISYSTYLAELTLQVYKENRNPKIYDLFSQTIFKIEEGFDEKILTNILEIKYLNFLGVSLKLDGCIKCGNQRDIVTIDGSFGGLICKNCYENGPLIKPAVIKLLRQYFYVDIKSITKLNVDKTLSNEINNFINHYYDDFTGIYVYSKKFLEKLL